MISRRNKRKILAKIILNKQNAIRGRSRNLVAERPAGGGYSPHALETCAGAFSDLRENSINISIIK
jgi:hypothetical protein